MSRPYDEYRDTPIWRTIAAALAELEGNKDLAIQTAPDYVIGYLCQQLVVRRIVAQSALDYDP